MLGAIADMIKLKNNKSFCPVCLDIVESDVVERNGRVYLDIYCPKHGKFENLHKWEVPIYYKTMERPDIEYIEKYPMGLLIETNFDCNQNCNFCYAQANERRETSPTLAEIIKKVNGFKGVHIMLAGGEPTLREDLPIIIRELKKRKFIVTLCTNGKKLVDKVYVKKLKDAGLDNVQLQFDTMDDSQYEFIRNERLTDLKLKVVNNLKEANILIYLFVPLIKGLNDNQVKNIVSFAAQNSSVIKIVFLMPMWLEGRTLEHNSITAEEIIQILQSEYNLQEDAFKDYAKFDFYTSLLYQRLTNKPFFKYQPCTVSYYFFYLRKSIIPLSEIIDLHKFNYFLECVCKLLAEKGALTKIYYFFRISLPFFIKEILLNKKIRPFIFALLRTLFSHILFDVPPMIKDNYSLQIRVERFFDRYNSDFRMLRQCNLYVFLKDELVPFCQGELARKKYMP
jgi:hypothetical protein